MTTLPDGSKRTFQDLLSHVKEIRKSQNQMRVFNSCYTKLGYFFDGFGGVPIKEEVLEIFGKIQINSFGNNGTGGFGSAGICLYLESSAIDHSCSPNAEVGQLGKKMLIRCVKDEPGEFPQVRVSYCDMLLLREERRKFLKESYYFDCECKECSDKDSVREACGRACVRCPWCSKGVPLNVHDKVDDVTCRHCKKVVPRDHMVAYWQMREEAELEGQDLISHDLFRKMRTVFYPTDRRYLAKLWDFLRDSDTDQVRVA